ncbi:SRPBCC family protein [Nesterenkonia rhizosphaerae]|uniref:SRPBCC family protein n=1 Tax=Nesterenkonia rhizosphaerae TaxID=1348272 RepID=A0ABP9FVP6_9MICC
MTEQQVVTASGVIEAPADVIFELIADPARQPEWDGNDNLTSANPGQRVGAVGEKFLMTLTSGKTRENHVVEFAEGQLIAWKPSPIGKPQPGHLWRWELKALDANRTEVVHTYDWTQLDDPDRLERARNTTSEKLEASILRLKKVAEAV